MNETLSTLGSSYIQWGFETEEKGKSQPFFRQVHGNSVLCLDEDTDLQDADAGFTRRQNHSIYVFTADCIPILLYPDSADGPIAAIHSGWRGALQGVVDATITAMAYPRARLHAVIGPCIHSCCFEVQADFVDAFNAAKRPIAPYLERRDGKLYCDLLRFVLVEELGAVGDVHIDSRCTVCSGAKLPSYRRDKSTARIRSWIKKTAPSPTGL